MSCKPRRSGDGSVSVNTRRERAQRGPWDAYIYDDVCAPREASRLSAFARDVFFTASQFGGARPQKLEDDSDLLPTSADFGGNFFQAAGQPNPKITGPNTSTGCGDTAEWLRGADNIRRPRPMQHLSNFALPYAVDGG